MFKSASTICTALSVLAFTNPGVAQQAAPATTNQTAPINRIPLQRFDVPESAYETVIGVAEIAPSVSIGRHRHPGPESGYVLEGDFELLIDGEPPRHLKAGESYKVPPHIVHDAKTGSNGAKVIATYVVKKGQPLASAAK
jgi:quercetin dioxygenase-like cupin family protein